MDDIDFSSMANLRSIEADTNRLETFSHKIDILDEFIYFDFSKTHISKSELLKIKEEFVKKGIIDQVQGMFDGAILNYTEQRKVLHTILRNESVLRKIENSAHDLDCIEEGKAVYAELKKIRQFTEIVHQKKMNGITGKPLTTIVNIGIGGSDLGPRVICQSLESYKIIGMSSHFISNIDPMELKNTLEGIDLESTLFVVVSKTFTTQETISNARCAINFVVDKLNCNREDLIAKQFIAVSSNNAEVQKFGIRNIFDMWDYVGGRYSLWSAVGISIALFVGFDNFYRLLKGASIMDEKFRTQSLDSLPMLHAILEIYYGKLNYSTKCILPYDYYLRNFYKYLQQLEMESNGKMATKSNQMADYQTGMVIWGGVGTDAQHSFFQLLHQGTHKIFTEFLLPLSQDMEFKTGNHSHHSILFANCLAQSEALAKGKPSDDVNRVFHGSRPSSTIIYSKLTPEILGALISHYENKVFLQGLFFEINSFDQFGVELGKSIAKGIVGKIEGEDNGDEYSESTKKMIEMIRTAKYY